MDVENWKQISKWCNWTLLAIWTPGNPADTSSNMSQPCKNSEFQEPLKFIAVASQLDITFVTAPTELCGVSTNVKKLNCAAWQRTSSAEGHRDNLCGRMPRKKSCDSHSWFQPSPKQMTKTIHQDLHQPEEHKLPLVKCIQEGQQLLGTGDLRRETQKEWQEGDVGGWCRRNARYVKRHIWRKRMKGAM